MGHDEAELSCKKLGHGDLEAVHTSGRKFDVRHSRCVLKMLVANSFDLWRKDAFFSAAEEVQESADMYVPRFVSLIHGSCFGPLSVVFHWLNLITRLGKFLVKVCILGIVSIVLVLVFCFSYCRVFRCS